MHVERGATRRGGRLRPGVLAVAAALWSAILGMTVRAAMAEEPSVSVAAAGRALALTACTGCHVVAPDQPFKPVLNGPSPPPDFRGIANRPDTTALSLDRFLSRLHPLPSHLQRMADPYLSKDDREKIIAFIMTLRTPQ